MTVAETEEYRRLSMVTGRLREALANVDSRLAGYARDIKDEKAYYWASKSSMDSAEQAFTRKAIDQAISTGEAALGQQRRLTKLLFSPYFGRFDFSPAGRAQAEPIYVGIHHFADEADRKTLIYDWRAPISTMFYDYETGPASYEAPAGDIDGDILLKRQFRIRDGRMVFMLETAVHIGDEVLQEELSRASEDGMKQIVATIQREQNAIIRNDYARELIIQGVAGSGKTSVALHRIAFLLYRYKDTLTSQDILILSPNRVFADYISNVLPELGEESVAEMSMETLASELLDHAFGFQTFFEETALLLESEDAGMRRRIEKKSSLEFLDTLNEYAEHLEETCFVPEDIEVGTHTVAAGFVESAFRRHRGEPSTERLRETVDDIEQHVGIRFNHDLTRVQKTEIRAKVRKMYRGTNLTAAYMDLFEWMEEPELFKTVNDEGKLEYSDVFPLIYLKVQLEGIETEHRNIKHLLIDEMQDYTPVQYAVIAKLFRCKKTILGDAKQSVNPYSSSRGEQIQAVFRQASYVKLSKSYRSTYEISRFAQRISPDPDLVAMERHGEVPQILQCSNTEEEVQLTASAAREFVSSGYNTLGIVCKTQPQAERLFAALSDAGINLHLLTGHSTRFARGITICTAHMAKGLEFDHVIVPDVSASNYRTAMDRNLLYVACTRAMHKLTLTHAGKPTPLIQSPPL